MGNHKNDDLDQFVQSLFGNKTNKKKDDNVKDAKIVDVKPKKPFNTRKFVQSAVAISIVFAAFVIVLANVYVVKENEYRVVRQFGEVVKYEKEPGLHMKIPFIQSVTTLPKNLMTYNMTEEEINTLDKKRIIIDNYAVWRITDPKALISNARSLVNAQSRMEEFIYSSIRTELGLLNYDEIINAKKSSSRGNINESITNRVNELLTQDQYGIEVVDIQIRRIDLPTENEQSIYTRMISDRESIAQKYLSEGDAEKNRIEATTDKQVQELLSTARKDAALITAEGESEAAQIYNSSFSKDPQFYQLYRTLESYKKTIGDDTVIILPSDSPYARVLSGYMN